MYVRGYACEVYGCEGAFEVLRVREALGVDRFRIVESALVRC